MRTRYTQNCHLNPPQSEQGKHICIIQRHAYILVQRIWGHAYIKHPSKRLPLYIDDDRYDFLFLNADAFYQIYIIVHLFFLLLKYNLRENRNPQSPILFWSDNRADLTDDNVTIFIYYGYDDGILRSNVENMLRNMRTFCTLQTKNICTVNYSEYSNAGWTEYGK